MQGENARYVGQMRFLELTKMASYTRYAEKITGRNLINLIQSMRAPVLMQAHHGTMDLFTYTH